MNEAPSPYQVSQSGMSAPPPPEAFPASRSAIPKVFGIINIVYACLGGIWALFSLGVVFLMKTVISKNAGELNEAGTFLEAYDKLLVYTYIDAGLKFVLAIILLVAGIGLLRRRMWAQKATLFWAVFRIVAAVVMVAVTMGPSREFQETVNQASQDQQAEIQQMAQGVGSVVGVIFLCIYPVLCLVFMSKKSTKDALS